MAPLYLIGYIIVVGLFIRVTTHWDREKLPLIIAILIAAFIGWFVLLGMVIKGHGEKSGISVTKGGAGDGMKLLGVWLATMLFLLAAGGVLVAINWLLTGK